MDWLNRRRQQSQLGQILLGRKLISEEQLAEAIRAQGRSGRRLGEVLAEMHLVTEAQVGRAIRRQRNLRLAAALAASLLGPLQAYAAAPVATVGIRAGASSLRELGDEDMRTVSGQGNDDERLREQALRAQLHLAAAAESGARAAPVQQGPARVIGELAMVFHPLAGLFGAETSVSDVRYDPERSTAIVNKDGSVTLSLPATIGQIRLRNIRVGNAASGPSFGSIELRDIDLRGTTITVMPRGGGR